jgi:hypothetical protein
MTVIGEPQGATFIASKFVPENKALGGQADAAVGSGSGRSRRRPAKNRRVRLDGAPSP